MKKDIRKIIKKTLSELQKKESWDDFEMPEIEVAYPKNENFGDYSTNAAMVLGWRLKKNPLNIAEKTVNILKCHPELVSGSQEMLKRVQHDNIFEKIEVAAPGYINFYLSKNYLQKKAAEINNLGEKYGNFQNRKEKVMVEYSQPNTHKEFHIGHLRNAVIGSTLVNLFKKSGYETVAANYVGDTGTHVAKCLWGMTKFYPNENFEKIKNKAEFLGKVYSEASIKIEENKEYEKEFKELQKKFEEGNQALIDLWNKTRQWSLDEFSSVYKELGINFDIYFYESEEEKEGREMLPELLDKKIAEKSDGAVIVNLEKYRLGVLVLMRRDGAVLYGLKDLPLASKKFTQFGIGKSIIVADIRQNLYFKQIFKILELFGFQKDMVHIGYEFVALKGGESMASRKGNIISAKKLFSEVIKKVKNKFPESGVSQEIGLGAIKFFMLKYSGSSKIEFDIEEAIKLEGSTGPYVQYAYARIRSILSKAESQKVGLFGENSADLSLLTHEKELNLIKELNKFPELVEEIAQNYEVHKLPYYAIKMADKFHSFYNDCRVIDEENPALTGARLELVKAVRIVLAEVLRLMGVSSPTHM
jgi:arginyl-tRNA synthetase